MPWKETWVMDRRIEFVLRALREEGAFGALCQEYGIRHAQIFHSLSALSLPR